MTIDLAGMIRAGEIIAAMQRPLPPGLAASFIELAAKGRAAAAAGTLGAILAYSGAAGMLLGLRLRAEYRGVLIKEPSFSFKGLRTGVYQNLNNPVVGIAYHF